MLSRVGLVAGATTAAAVLPIWQSNKVFAAAPEPEQKKKIRPSELPIYGEPEEPELEVLPEWNTAFHRKISGARQWTWSYLDSIQDTTNRIQHKCDVAKAHSADTLAYIQADSSIAVRVAIITVSGLGGIVAGYRGGIVKKTFLATTAMAAASSVCYPKQAGVIGREAWSLASDFANTTYHDLFDSSSTKKVAKDKPTKDETTKEKPTMKNPNLPKMDFGMSKPEDKDMYTTRDG